MPSNPQRKLPFHPARAAYRTLQGWALGTLIEQGAVVECEHHGHRRDRADPDAWNRDELVGPDLPITQEFLAQMVSGEPP